MKFTIQDHWLTGGRQIHSPNFDDLPDLPTLIVLHNISLPPNQFGGEGVIELFTNQLDPTTHPYYQQIHTLKVSSHLWIRRDGEVVQFVPFNKRAWHAGVSNHKGRERCNDFSIGIELEGSDFVAFEPLQYQALQQVLEVLRQHYPSLKQAEVVGHSDIAPGRKTDPGPFFDWQQVRDEWSP